VGLITFSKRGTTYTDEFTRKWGGGPFLDPPSFLFYPPPRFAKEFDLPTCAGRAFKNFFKSPFKFDHYVVVL
jgi:hypothetical protein